MLKRRQSGLKNKDKIIENKIFEKKGFYTTDEYNEMYVIVREYVHEHEGANAVEVSEATTVPKSVILEFIRQGRISLLDESKTLLNKCRKCGALIEKGYICIDCLKKGFYDATHVEEKRAVGSATPMRSTGLDKNVGRRIRRK